MEAGKNSKSSHHSRSNNSHSNSNNSNWVDAYCGCGEKAPLRTSNTYANPRRRFLGCINYEETNACKFFIWVDPPTCARGLDYSRHLQEKIKELEKKEDKLERLTEVIEKDLEKMMKKMDKLMRINNELKKKNEVMWKCNVLGMVVIGVLLVLWLANWKHIYGGMLYLP
ncbi:uncharacterized protein At4g04775-like [Rhododendron vialii]|uniref:uncharacterized protein At4g04775-like n=1 Tax=Rhododendron vialii TaxID=182163 RepID=UPI00265D8A34|nr:uncharacterized protein At4g04775-like [Rhododendron vialii]